MARLLLGLALAALVGAAAADPPRPWRLTGDSVFLRETAIDANGAIAMAQDREGFIWIGNQAGLLRWDGYRTRTYAPDPDTPGALPDNYVTALLVDVRGRLWIGTETGGLARYDAGTDSFVTMRVGAGGLRDASVSALCDDGEGGLWIATRAGLDHMNGASGAITPLTDARLPAGRIQALLRDRNGVLWIGASGGLARRGAQGGPFVPLAVPTRDQSVPAIHTLFEDADGRVWVGTNAHGAFVADLGQGALRPVVEDDSRSGAMTDTIRAIAQARDGEVWLGTANSGILRVETAPWRVRRERHDDSRPLSLASDEILALLRDRDGWVWIGTSGELSGYAPRPGVAETFYGGSNPSRLVSHASVMSVLALPSGRVWIGLGEGGIEIIDPMLGRIGHVRPDPTHPTTALPRSRITSFALAPDGSVFLGTQGGLYRTDSEGAQVERVGVPERAPTSEVRTLIVDRDVLWVGGRDGLWELRFKGRGQTLELLRHYEAELGDPRVSVIERGGEDALWIGTFGGLERLDRHTGALIPVPIDDDDKSRQRGWDVSAVLTDHQGRLWISTFGRGIQVERGRAPDGRRLFQRLTTRNGLPHNGVDKLLIDRHGDVWASTDGGLAQIDARTLAIRAYRQAQGVGILTYWTGSGDVTPAGELIFGGIGGLMVVHPERHAEAAGAPPLVITEVHVGERMVPAELLRGGLPLQLGVDDRSLMVEFAALSFSEPEHRRYGYRLLGFDPDWVPTPTSRRLASYTNLPPGDYTLQLRTAGDDGQWSQPVEVPVHVPAAWYQHDLVRAAALLLALVFVGGLVNLRTHYLRRRQSELQRLVQERTKELEVRGEELQASHEELRRSQEQLEKMAYFDALTGLPNRRMFNEDVRQLVARSLRGQGDFALVLVDLDGFKQINDQYGHHVGDALLIVVADRLRSLVRDTDRVARLGGDEFAVLLANAFTPERVEAMCARMVASLREPMLVAGQTVQVTASLGIAPCPRDGQTPDELYKAADMALYDAKRSGRDTWRWSMVGVYTFTVG